MPDDRLPPSNRARKKIVNAGVNRLLETPGWNPHRRVPSDPDPARAAREALRDAQVTRAEGEANACPGCEAARKASGDPTDLCPKHLAEAMGL